jgi:hypothetical protein
VYPGLHEQEEEPVVEFAFGPQEKQLKLAAAEKVPAGHCVHVPLSYVPLNAPATQGTQALPFDE